MLKEVLSISCHLQIAWSYCMYVEKKYIFPTMIRFGFFQVHSVACPLRGE